MTQQTDKEMVRELVEIIAKHDFDNENFEAEWFNATSAEKNQYRINAKDLAATIYNAGYRLPVKHKVISDEELEAAEKIAFAEWQKTPEYKEALKSQFHFDIFKGIVLRKAHAQAQVDKDNKE